jgi:hypothetical protein
MSSEGDNVLTCKPNVAELLDHVYFRYRRNKKDGNTKKQGGNKSTGFNNNAFTNDYVNTGKIISYKALIVGKVVPFRHV